MTIQTATDAIVDLQRKLAESQEKTAGLNGTCEFRLDGEDGGDWHIVFQSGAPELRDGRAGQPDTTISMTGTDFVAMHVGTLDPSVAFATGRLRVSGDATLGMRLGGIMRREGQERAVTPEPIIKLAASFMASKYLFVANEIGIFEQLGDNRLTLAELAARCQVPVRTLRIVLDALVGLDILEREGDGYRNGLSAAFFLTGRSPVDLRAYLRFWNQISWRRWMNLETTVRTDQVVPLPLDPDEQRLMAEGIEAITSRVAIALAGGYEFEQHKRLLDVGGGTGSFLIAAAKHRPLLQGTLLEVAAVATFARQRIAESGLADRLQVVDGDVFRNPIPPGHDAVLIANVIHVFRPEQNVELLRRVRAAVEPGAKLLLVDIWRGESRSQPLQAALTAGEYLLVNGGDAYSLSDVTGWFVETGWELVEQRPLIGPATLILAQARSL